MSFFADWLTVFIVGVIVVVSPGPDFALTLRNSLTYSRQAGIYTAIGIGAGNLVHTSYSLVGIGAIISRSIVLFNVMKWLGAGYLIYIGIKSLQAKKQSSEVSDIQTKKNISRWMAFRIGFFGLFFVALFTQIIHPSTPLFAQAIYGATVALMALVWFALIASVIPQGIIRNVHWLERITGVVLIGLGLRLAIASSKE
jgi:threonine/homoserine/homoserine lactone efflux protein